MWETQVQLLDWEDPLEKETAAHSSILAWRIPWTGEPGRLQFTASQRVGHDWATDGWVNVPCRGWDMRKGHLLVRMQWKPLPWTLLKARSVNFMSIQLSFWHRGRMQLLIVLEMENIGMINRRKWSRKEYVLDKCQLNWMKCHRF